MSHPELIAAAHRDIDEHGFGLCSVRFICGSQRSAAHEREHLARALAGFAMVGGKLGVLS